MTPHPPAFQPLLSVITINKNNAAGLVRTIESFSEIEDHSLLEFVFIDGNSSDNSLNQAVGFYPKNNIHVANDSGVYDAMNKGLNVASGNFVLWINSGDEIMACNVISLLEAVKSSTADVLCFSSFICDENEAESRTLHVASEDKLPYSWLAHPAVIYRRKALLQLGGYLCVYKITADHESLLALKRGCASFEFYGLPVSRFYAGGLSSSWHAEVEREKLNYDYRLVGVKTVYMRCRRWLGVPKSILYTLGIVVTSPFRRFLISKRVDAFLRLRFA